MTLKLPGSGATPSQPNVPTPPPNPPMFGSQASKAAGDRQKKQGMGQGYGGTVLGNGSPGNTGQKTLLGQ